MPSPFLPRSFHRARAALVAAAAIAASPAALAQSDFAACLDSIREQAVAQGVPRATADGALRGLTPDPKVLDLDGRQPEFSLTLGRYLGNAISPERIAKGREMLVRHRSQLDAIEREFGVPPSYIVSFWGMESNYGAFTGDFPVIRSVATLACATSRREFFSNELVMALRILAANHMTPAQMRGSWAGAMGNTQFMPSTYVNYAIDRDGDGRVDLWRSLPDVFGSSANYLAKVGWKRGQPSHEEVVLPANFDYARVDPTVERPIREWRAMGITRADGRPLSDSTEKAALALPAGHRGPAFLLWPNYKVIMIWNRSQLYALAVGQLAQQLQGSPGLVRQPPADDQPIARADVVDLQNRLQRLGLYQDDIDGLLGPKTRAAFRAFQVRARLVADGYPTPDGLARLRAAAP